MWVDGQDAIKDWTWHAPRDHTYEFVLAESRSVNIRVEHFELDGYAVLSVGIEPVE